MKLIFVSWGISGQWTADSEQRTAWAQDRKLCGGMVKQNAERTKQNAESADGTCAIIVVVIIDQRQLCFLGADFAGHEDPKGYLAYCFLFWYSMAPLWGMGENTLPGILLLSSIPLVQQYNETRK